MRLKITEISENNEFMALAKRLALEMSLDQGHPTGAVIVSEDFDEKLLGLGWNGSIWHEMHDCARKKQQIPSGKGYDLCFGCYPHFHAERRALRSFASRKLAQKIPKNLKNPKIYLWGHYWACETCEKHLLAAGITQMYLVCDAKSKFGR